MGSTSLIEETVISGNHNQMWTNWEPARINPRRDLVGFMRKMKDRGIYAGLSSWYRLDENKREHLVRCPDDYARIWIETLDFLVEHDLLDMAVWVDLCNEFPRPAWAIGPASDIFDIDLIGGSDSKDIAYFALAAPWSDRVVSRLNEYLTQPIKKIRQRYPQLKYTFSFAAMSPEQRNVLNLSEFDLLEPHIWAVEDKTLIEKTKFLEGLNGDYPFATLEHMKLWITQYQENKDLVRVSLCQLTSAWAALADKLQLPLITSECWATLIFEDLFHAGALGEWETIKDGAEVGIQLALEKGWQGIATSNFCEPHFEGIWNDIGWHKEMTSLINQAK